MKQLRIAFLILIILIGEPAGTVQSSGYTSGFVNSLSTPYKNTDALSVLSWNIYMLPLLGALHQNKKRAELIADSLKASSYDVVVFQEAFCSNIREIISQKLLTSYPYQYGPINKERSVFQINSGLWVLSKIPLSERGSICFKGSQGFDAVARKGAALFEGVLNGKRFQLLATHLQAFEAPGLRKEQCREIRTALLDKYLEKNVPQLLCGDFNIEMDSQQEYQQMLTTLDASNGELSGNLRLTYDEIGNNLARKAGGTRSVIDYILIRNPHVIRGVQRRVRCFQAQSKNYNSNLSDHYAMEIQVDLGNHEHQTLN